MTDTIPAAIVCTDPARNAAVAAAHAAYRQADAAYQQARADASRAAAAYYAAGRRDVVTRDNYAACDDAAVAMRAAYAAREAAHRAWYDTWLALNV